MAEYDDYGNKEKDYMNPYAENSPGAAMEACYNACQSCYYAMDHRMMLQCCHPKRATLMVYDIQGRAESDEGFRLQENSNYCVETSWWCKNFEAVGYDNSPGMYGSHKDKRKKTGVGAVGGATAGNPHKGNYGAKKMEKENWHNGPGGGLNQSNTGGGY